MSEKPQNLTIQERAKISAAMMMESDFVFQNLGAHLESINPDKATVSLKIDRKHLNGHGFCHGGVIFTLADTTFGLACNSSNVKSVAQHCTITFIAPIREGDHLTCEAKIIKKFRRSAIYDVTICNRADDIVGLFRGHSKQVGGNIFDEASIVKHV